MRSFNSLTIVVRNILLKNQTKRRELKKISTFDKQYLSSPAILQVGIFSVKILLYNNVRTLSILVWRNDDPVAT